MTLNACLQYYNREKLETMENLLYSAHSSLDIGIEEEDDSVDGPHPIDPSILKQDLKDDGGEAEGKTITPLERRIDALDQRASDVLTVDKPAPATEEQPAEEQPANNKPTRKIPAWAQ